MGIEVDMITGPACFACALVNGDESGLEDSDIECLRAFEKDITPWYVVDVARDENGDGIEPRFTWSYALYGGSVQGGDVLDYVVHKVTE